MPVSSAENTVSFVILEITTIVAWLNGTLVIVTTTMTSTAAIFLLKNLFPEIIVMCHQRALALQD